MRPLLLLDFDGPLNPHRAKTPYVANWVGDRPFVWVDDDVDDFDVTYFAEDHQLVLRVDASTGLTPDDFAAIRAWHTENRLSCRIRGSFPPAFGHRSSS
ncbi:hypothetical protein OG555_04140 [Kribbella sp. NBC_01484]|uniref:hypothetical protein n=1 Tax=Kribbella sp. NBC_01484 TaxID=2903579 RepID=UPI002E371A03|nr:hypothetical protein [Kribbella sp. NBC_01484]